MPVVSLAATVAFGLFAANFLYALAESHNFVTAAERSFFQGIALAVLVLALKRADRS